MRNKRQRYSAGTYGTVDYGYVPSTVTNPYVALYSANLPPMTGSVGSHPLHDVGHNARLLARESQITAAFDAITPALQAVAAMQFEAGFAERAQAQVRSHLNFELPSDCLKASWVAPLNMRALYAYSTFRTFCKLANHDFDRNYANLSEGEPADELIRKWGFHAIDITPCADGRLSGVVDYILRIPPAVVVHRKSFAGAMFDVEESVRNWVEVELRRYRENSPNKVDEPTRYLKIGVYHTSGSDPGHEGCAAHGSDERRAAQALLERLNGFAQAVSNSHCCGASIATLLVGVDTDTDAIKVHVPDTQGHLSLDRFVDNRSLFDAISGLTRDEAKESIRGAVAEVAGVSPDDAVTQGMRWFCAYLLKNNMAQIEYVRAHHGGCYTDLGHTERFITVGDSFDDVQMRNLAYQAQMETVEEGAADMDVGIKIFKKVNIARGLPIPVFVHFRYDGQVPGSRDRAVARAQRLEHAIAARYQDLVREGWLYSYTTIKDHKIDSPLESFEGFEKASERRCACGCDKAESR